MSEWGPPLLLAPDFFEAKGLVEASAAWMGRLASQAKALSGAALKSRA